MKGRKRRRKERRKKERRRVSCRVTNAPFYQHSVTFFRPSSLHTLRYESAKWEAINRQIDGRPWMVIHAHRSQYPVRWCKYLVNILRVSCEHRASLHALLSRWTVYSINGAIYERTFNCTVGDQVHTDRTRSLTWCTNSLSIKWVNIP